MSWVGSCLKLTGYQNTDYVYMNFLSDKLQYFIVWMLLLGGYHLFWSSLVFFLLFVDCCDGSDEYDGKVKCSNNCWEAGKVARDKLKKKIVTYEEGVLLRKQEFEQAQLALARDEAELSKLRKEESTLKGIVQQLKGIASLFPLILVKAFYCITFTS